MSPERIVVIIVYETFNIEGTLSQFILPRDEIWYPGHSFSCDCSICPQLGDYNVIL